MSKTSESWSSRQQRHLSFISEFTTDIQHVKGKDNRVADTLSRAITDIANVQLGIDYRAMARAQQQDAEVQAYRTASSSFQLEDIPFGTQGVYTPM